MGELYFKMSLSVDGFVGGPKGEADWIFAPTDPQSDAWDLAILRDVGLHIMGSKTYMRAWWPFSNEVFAPVMNEISKAVFTKRGAESLEQLPSSQAVADATAALLAKPLALELVSSTAFPKGASGQVYRPA